MTHYWSSSTDWNLLPPRRKKSDHWNLRQVREVNPSPSLLCICRSALSQWAILEYSGPSDSSRKLISKEILFTTLILGYLTYCLSHSYLPDCASLSKLILSLPSTLSQITEETDHKWTDLTTNPRYKGVQLTGRIHSHNFCRAAHSKIQYTHCHLCKQHFGHSPLKGRYKPLFFLCTHHTIGSLFILIWLRKRLSSLSVYFHSLKWSNLSLSFLWKKDLKHSVSFPRGPII